jgi:hypothetical protein
VPRVIVSDKPRSYGVAQRQLLPKVEHRQSRYLNNRAENSHRPTRRRERQMQRFKSPEQAQDFLSAHAFIHGHFHPRRHLLSRNSNPGIQYLAAGDMRSASCMTDLKYSIMPLTRPTKINVTMPAGNIKHGRSREHPRELASGFPHRSNGAAKESAGAGSASRLPSECRLRQSVAHRNNQHSGFTLI